MKQFFIIVCAILTACGILYLIVEHQGYNSTLSNLDTQFRAADAYLKINDPEGYAKIRADDRRFYLMGGCVALLTVIAILTVIRRAKHHR
jgi:hypothetical protein